MDQRFDQRGLWYCKRDCNLRKSEKKINKVSSLFEMYNVVETSCQLEFYLLIVWQDKRN